MYATKQSITAPCPDCGYELRLGPNPQKYEKLTCPECWAYLEIVSLNPLKLAWENIDENEEAGFDWAGEDNDEDDVTGSNS